MRSTHNVDIDARNPSSVTIECDCGWNEVNLMTLGIAKDLWRVHLRRSGHARMGSVNVRR